MTLGDIVHGWSADKTVPIVRLAVSVVTMLVTCITAIWAAGFFVSGLNSAIETVRKDQSRIERDQDNLRAMVIGMPDRMTRIETKLEEAATGQTKLLIDIKTILEGRTTIIAPITPKVSVPVRRP